MAYINDINNFNLINFNNLPIINNELPAEENELEIGWFIDRRPDFNIINNINRNDINNINDIRNEEFNQQFIQATQALLNGTINFQPNEDEFIPFQHEPLLNPVIETEVREIQVSEEERDCPICYEIKEREEISQLNCQHKFCTNCITEHIHRNRSETRCPFCRENITHITFQNDINEEHFQYI
jgi:hypothetical protein